MVRTKLKVVTRVCLLASLINLVVHGGEFESRKVAPISHVDSYQGIVDVAGKYDNIGTGERFEREVIMLLYRNGECEADFDKFKLDIFAREAQEDVALISAEIDNVDEAFKNYLDLSNHKFTCPTGVVIRHRSLINKPEYIWLEYSENIDFGESIFKTQNFSIGSVNDYTFPITVTYTQFNMPEKTLVKEILPEKTVWSELYRTNELIAKTLDGKELQRMKVRADALFTVADRFCNIENCGIIERPKEVDYDEEEIQKFIKNHKYLQEVNMKQPKELPKFTKFGFDKIRVPDEVWDMIIEYYENNKNKPKIERWKKGSVIINNVEAPSFIVTIPENGRFKPRIFEILKPILEEWSGVELIPTACYGIRAYTNGSWITNHLDRRNTHAVSVIINLDQEVEEPWILNIFDHAGNLHNITMQPRDMVLYESAVCIHGRPTPLNGKFYVNMFVHFKPKEYENWDKYALKQ